MLRMIGNFFWGIMSIIASVAGWITALFILGLFTVFCIAIALFVLVCMIPIVTLCLILALIFGD